jgi:hypothetical protein
MIPKSGVPVFGQDHAQKNVSVDFAVLKPRRML